MRHNVTRACVLIAASVFVDASELPGQPTEGIVKSSDGLKIHSLAAGQGKPREPVGHVTVSR